MKKLTMLFLTVIATACGPAIRVYTDRDHDYNIREHPTFTWATDEDIEKRNNPLYYNELNDKRIKTAVNEELHKKGYAQTIDNPALMVHYHIVVENRASVMVEPYGYYYGSYWTRLGKDVYQYREGTLIIDLMDSKNNNLIWRGWAVSILEDVYTPAEVEANIKIAVEKIFKDFPTSIEKKPINPLSRK